jgi:hypothetical protein
MGLLSFIGKHVGPLLICVMCFSLAQHQVQAQKPANIELISADRMQFDRSIGDDVRRLIDHVHFRHEDTRYVLR